MHAGHVVLHSAQGVTIRKTGGRQRDSSHVPVICAVRSTGRTPSYHPHQHVPSDHPAPTITGATHCRIHWSRRPVSDGLFVPEYALRLSAAGRSEAGGGLEVQHLPRQHLHGEGASNELAGAWAGAPAAYAECLPRGRRGSVEFRRVFLRVSCGWRVRCVRAKRGETRNP